ncbi:hypothetical protein LR48_Vigan04g096200 [Vigna angularis]|uniref:Aminotransferase-like plant mobile domain-containing protein n=1 Tax=Phaseolus angularis TaxID=3914 RepID=A0A0L9UDZ6_PHAAN|nr:hypothetical protein LR48_Vigan04g096200 [Vigna angularis]
MFPNILQTQALGRAVHVDEVFAQTHVRSEHESAPTPDDGSNAEDDIRRTQCWVNIVGGKKKGRVYGAGHHAANYTASRGGTLKHQPSSFTTAPDEVVLRLTQALEQRDQEITDLRAEFTNFKALILINDYIFEMHIMLLPFGKNLCYLITEDICPSVITEGFYPSKITEGFRPSEITEGFCPSVITEGFRPSVITEGQKPSVNVSDKGFTEGSLAVDTPSVNTLYRGLLAFSEGLWPSDDPIVEERAFEEQTYEAYETHDQEDAFEAPDDDDDEEEHADIHDIQEDVGGFPGGPRDGSLLMHYVQHVAYAISQGRSWIYEHFPGMGRRRLVSSYDDTTPGAMRWQSPRQSSILAKIRSQLNALTYSRVVWHSYEGNRGIRPFFDICMYSGWIWIGAPFPHIMLQSC